MNRWVASLLKFLPLALIIYVFSSLTSLDRPEIKRPQIDRAATLERFETAKERVENLSHEYSEASDTNGDIDDTKVSRDIEENVESFTEGPNNDDATISSTVNTITEFNTKVNGDIEENVELFTEHPNEDDATISSTTTDTTPEFSKDVTRPVKKNVLFIIADDLRSNLAGFAKESGLQTLANPEMITPNIEALTKKSIVFNRAYVQYPVCGPSRASFLLSRRPDTTQIYRFAGCHRKTNATMDMITMPEHFRMNGYRTYGFGKVYHTNCNDSLSFDEEDLGSYAYEPRAKHIQKNTGDTWLKISTLEEELLPTMDTHSANKAMAAMENSMNSSEPFFIALGFRRPHFPQIYPEIFHDLYSDIPEPFHPDLPDKLPYCADRHEIGYPLRKCKQILHNNTEECIKEATRMTRQSYFAAVSHIDHELGRVINRLEELKLERDTIITFVSDHGFMLGELGQWRKKSLLDPVTRVPMLIKVPGVTDVGWRTEQPVELVDFFPTLNELAGIPQVNECPEKDSAKVRLCTEGKSLMPLIKKEDKEELYAYTQTYREIKNNNDWEHFDGRAIISQRYRYSEWFRLEGELLADGNLEAIELYDHKNDPDELNNVADRISKQHVIKNLREKLRDKFGLRNMFSFND